MSMKLIIVALVALLLLVPAFVFGQEADTMDEMLGKAQIGRAHV